MQTTTDAISKEDWALVAKSAHKIAQHAEPPLSERKLIVDWLGSNSEPFEELDEHTHEAARAMRKAAALLRAKLMPPQQLPIRLNCRAHLCLAEISRIRR
jgi:hypothetical protein